MIKKCLTAVLILMAGSGVIFAQTADENKTREIARSFINDFWNQENPDNVAEILPEKFALYAPSNEFEGMTISREMGIQRREMMGKWHPDLHYSIDDLLVEGNKAMIRTTGSFTHNEEVPTPFGLAKPTGNKVTYAVFFIIQIEDDKIVKIWDIYDAEARFGGMGVLDKERN